MTRKVTITRNFASLRPGLFRIYSFRDLTWRILLHSKFSCFIVIGSSCTFVLGKRSIFQSELYIIISTVPTSQTSCLLPPRRLLSLKPHPCGFACALLGTFVSLRVPIYLDIFTLKQKNHSISWVVVIAGAGLGVFLTDFLSAPTTPPPFAVGAIPGTSPQNCSALLTIFRAHSGSSPLRKTFTFMVK